MLPFLIAILAAQSPIERDVLKTGSEYLYLCPPEPIQAGTQSLKWSPDGSAILVQSERFPLAKIWKGPTVGVPGPELIAEAERTLALYFPATRKLRPLLKISVMAQIQTAEWIGNTGRGVIALTEPVDPRNLSAGVAMRICTFGTSTPLVTMVGPVSMNTESAEFVGVSKQGKFAVVRTPIVAEGDASGAWGTLAIFNYDGREQYRYPVPAESGATWSVDGSAVMLSTVQIRDGRRTIAITGYAANGPKRSYPGTRQMMDDGQPGSGRDPALRPDISVNNVPMPLSAPPPAPSTSISAVVISSESGKSLTFVTSDGEQGQISPNRKYVAYVHRGLSVVREIVKIPKEVYDQARLAAEKAKILSDAKQTALALIIYAADYDDVMPPNDGTWQDKVFPYIKNRNVFSGFVYTFGGGSIAKIENPAEVEMGHIPGPGGRAVAYLDGHVRWIPDR